MNASMELVDFLAAGQLVQAVDVLCDHADQLALLFQLGQGLMGPVGLGPGGDEVVLVIVEERYRIALEEIDGQHLFGASAVVVLRVIQTVFAAEIRHTALGGYAGAAEKDDALRFVQYLFQFFVHGCSFRNYFQSVRGEESRPRTRSR